MKSANSESFPRLISASFNLRRVASNLYVGGSPSVTELASPRGTLLDLYGREPGYTAREVAIGKMGASYRMSFPDGAEVPFEVFETAERLYRGVVDRNFSKPLDGPDDFLLVSCFAGVSRSASVVYALLRRVDGLPHAEAYRRVTEESASFVSLNPLTFASARRYAESGKEPVTPKTPPEPPSFTPSEIEELRHLVQSVGGIGTLREIVRTSSLAHRRPPPRTGL